MDAASRTLERREGMTIATAIIFTGALIIIAMVWCGPTVYDYHTDLKNITYQLSRIADALNRKGEKNEIN